MGQVWSGNYHKVQTPDDYEKAYTEEEIEAMVKAGQKYENLISPVYDLVESSSDSVDEAMEILETRIWLRE